MYRKRQPRYTAVGTAVTEHGTIRSRPMCVTYALSWQLRPHALQRLVNLMHCSVSHACTLLLIAFSEQDQRHIRLQSRPLQQRANANANHVVLPLSDLHAASAYVRSAADVNARGIHCLSESGRYVAHDRRRGMICSVASGYAFFLARRSDRLL